MDKLKKRIRATILDEKIPVTLEVPNHYEATRKMFHDWMNLLDELLYAGAAFYERIVCSWIASTLLLACFVWLASGLLLAVFVHRRGGFCTSGLLCLACFWLALSGLCCLGLACLARGVARKNKRPFV